MVAEEGMLYSASAHILIQVSLGLSPLKLDSLTSTMEVYRYPQFTPDFATVYVTLFAEVKNAAELKTRLVSASVMPGEGGDVEREAVNFAFIDARLVSEVCPDNRISQPKFCFPCRLPVYYTFRLLSTMLSSPPPTSHYGRKQFTPRSFGR